MTVTFPGTPLATRCRITLAGVPTDITSYVLWEAGVNIRHGGLREHAQATAATCDFNLHNSAVASRRFSPKNTTGPYYGKLRRYTPITFEYDFGEGWVTRFTGKVPEWSPRWTMQSDGTTRIRAFGRMHDIFDRGQYPLNSPMYDTISASAPVQYWPLEGSLNSAVAGGVPLGSGSADPVAGLNLTGDSSLPGSRPAVTVSEETSFLTGWSHSFSGHWQADWFFHADSAPAADTVAMRMFARGTVGIWDLVLGSGSWRMKAYSPAGVLLIDTGALFNSTFFYGQWTHLRLSVRDIGGGNIEWLFTNFPVPLATGYFQTGTFAGNFGDLSGWGVASQAGIEGWAYAHWAAHDRYDYSATDDSAQGFDTEVAGTRYQRMLDQNGIPGYVITPAGMNHTAMGAQPITDLGTVLREVETVAEGIMYEDPYDDLILRDFASLCYTSPLLIVDMGDVVDMAPVEGEFTLANKYTASSTDGFGSAVATVDAGPLSTSDIGVVPGSQSYNLADPADLAQHAHLRVMQGTVDAQRFDSIEFDFARSPSLLPTWVLVDVGSRMLIQSPGGHLGPDDVDQVILGYGERMTNLTLTGEVFTAPYDAFRVEILDEEHLRLDCGASYLNEALDTSETGVDVAILDRCSWAHDTGDYTITVGGEDMTVTAIGAVATSITFVAAGTAAAADSVSVSPGLPAGAAAGDLLLIWAACRDDDSRLDTPSGYQLLLDAGRARLFGKVHSGAESAPTVGFTGGAGDTVIAQMAAFTGAWGDLTHQVVSTSWQANGSSAQNIAYPSVDVDLSATVVLWLGWKADDWTSVATLADATAEIGEPDSTAGNDAGLVWDSRLSPGLIHFAPGSFVVTGGAAAESIGAVVVLRAARQTLTVTRSVNGAVLTHDIGEPVHVKHPIRLSM